MLDETGFNLWADNYDKTVAFCEEEDEYPFAGYKTVLNTIYRRIRSGHGKTVLDIGFGTGILSKKLYDDGIRIYGIDFSEEMIRLAQEKMPDATLLRHDFSGGLPAVFQDKRFDYIVSTYAIHHLTDEEKIVFLKDLQNHLTEDGEILIGDVAFGTMEEQDSCMQRSGEEWDDEEFYIVAEELAKHFTGLKFQKISHCSGVCIIK